MTPEELRLTQSRNRQAHWKRWGPYLSERAWGTVREDYSADGEVWEYFPHEHARSRAYRWNEDGLAGICDRHQYICFSVALWNERDPILKERLFGLTGDQGNHGEDVKECYFYLDSTPTHAYMKFLYKYPQARFPYDELLEENRKRTRQDPEYELQDTGIFRESRYFDVFVEYAKADPEDILIRITAVNRGPDRAPLHVLPTLWFRNTWSWQAESLRPQIHLANANALEVNHAAYPPRWLYFDDSLESLFTENETNTSQLYNSANSSPYVKDAFHRYLINREASAVNPSNLGTKAAVHYKCDLRPGESKSFHLRFTPQKLSAPFSGFDSIFTDRQREADEFFATIIPTSSTPDARNVARQAFAGMLWSKQFYHYVVKTWLDGDPAEPTPPAERKSGRNHAWQHLFNADVISMPDKWEYPWYAAWDLAFHCVPLALVDPDFAKEQLTLMLREWYMHPNGQLPAYEWNLGDVNPPVHAWAAWRVYKIDKKRSGVGDRQFLQRVFHKRFPSDSRCKCGNMCPIH